MTDRPCRACGSSDTATVLGLGDQRLSDFRADATPTPSHPLRLLRCAACGLGQLADTAPRGELYHDGYGYYSGVNEAVRADLADVVAHALRYVPQPVSWLDVASNDGTLLSCVPLSAYRVGVDPVAKFAPLAARHADDVRVGYVEDLHLDGRFDVVTSVSMFYDVDDPDRLVATVAGLLAAKGVWVVQQNSALAMLRQTAVDNLSHEHLTYFSFTSLRPLLTRHGLEVVDVTTSTVNGGSFRTVVAHAGAHPVRRDRVAGQLLNEAAARLNDPQAWAAFATRARQRLDALGAYVRNLTGWHGRVAVYGASTRGATLWQGAGLGQDELVYAVERNPAKVGRWYSAVGVPIVSEEAARADRPDLMLVGPWWLADQVVARERAYLEAGGRLLLPLPHLRVVTRDNLAPAAVARG